MNLSNFTNEQLGFMALILILVLVLLFNYFKKVEKKLNKPKKKPAPKKELTMEDLNKRIAALEKGKK